MIINATTGQGFTGALSYVEKEHEKNLTPEQQPEVLHEQNVFGNPREKAQQMRFVANGNSRASRPVLHVSVSFSDKEKLTPEKREKVLNDVVKELGATPENNQYVIVKHNDAGHEHYHIVMNKVGFNGQNINTSYIKNKCQVIADKLEQKHELQRVKGRTVVYDPSNEKGYRFTTKAERSKELKKPQDREQGVKDKKTYIQSEVGKALQESKSLADLKERLNTKGIETQYTQNKNGLSGVSFRYENQAVKGSAIGFKANTIKQEIERNTGQNITPYQEPKQEPKQKEDFFKEYKLISEVNKLEKQIESNERFKAQLSDLKLHAYNVLEDTKEKAFKGDDIVLKDSDKVAVSVNENGILTLTHKDNPKLKREFKELNYIAKQERYKGEKESEYQRKLKEYQDVQKAEYMPVPSSLQFWKAEERKKALEYNEKLRIKKQITREPSRTIYVDKGYNIYTIDNIEKSRLTAQAKINTMKKELSQLQSQQEKGKEPKQEQNQENRMQRAERLREEKEQNQEKSQNRSQGRKM